jgi:hypothetical protein
MSKPVWIGVSGSVLIIALVFVAVPPIAQEPTYHDFADQRAWLGISNFWNVMSNLPFLFIGIYGLAHARRRPGTEQSFAQIYSIGMLLICAGSSWYHLDPSNASLGWDRLAMTVSFMTAFAFVLGRVTGPGWADRLLWPLVAVGLLSVIYWNLTESAGRGDLRPYALVQFLPGLLIPALLLMRPKQFGAEVSRWIWLGLVAYVAAKLAEWQDAGLYQIGALLSGHSIKHLLAGLSGYYFLRALLVAEQEQESS